MNLTYTMQGDYLLPNLEVPEAPKVGKYGMLRRSFLQSHKKALYTGMMLADKLNTHLEEVDRQANEMLEKLLQKLSTATTSYPSSSKARQVWDPMYPAPPVTNTFIFVSFWFYSSP